MQALQECFLLSFNIVFYVGRDCNILLFYFLFFLLFELNEYIVIYSFNSISFILQGIDLIMHSKALFQNVVYNFLYRLTFVDRRKT